LRPVISLVLVMGPLIELPVLAINSAVLKNIRCNPPVGRG
jgi:hypothetical protein